MRKMSEALQKEAAALMAWEGNLTTKKVSDEQTKKDSEALKESGSFTLPLGAGKTVYSSRAGRKRK